LNRSNPEFSCLYLMDTKNQNQPMKCGFAVIRGTENGRQVNFLYAFSV